MKDKIHIYYWSPFISNVATLMQYWGYKNPKTYSNQKYVPHS